MENKKYVIFLTKDLTPFSLTDHLIKSKGVVFETEKTIEEIKRIVVKDISNESKLSK